MYKITIEKTEEIKRVVGNTWAVVGQEWVDAGGAVNKYGYTPEVEKVVEESRVVLLQTVESLAINGI
jgi:hypothetical protein